MVLALLKPELKVLSHSAQMLLALLKTELIVIAVATEQCTGTRRDLVSTALVDRPPEM